MSWGQRNESQKSILGIKQTQEISVTYEPNVGVDVSPVLERGTIGLGMVRASSAMSVTRIT